jgi:hypothetical protein
LKDLANELKVDNSFQEEINKCALIWGIKWVLLTVLIVK